MKIGALQGLDKLDYLPVMRHACQLPTLCPYPSPQSNLHPVPLTDDARLPVMFCFSSRG